MSDEEKTCHDCGARPGAYHVAGCDVERCTCCGGQRIGCGCKARAQRRREKWTGEWPGKAECRELGFWCVEVRGPSGHGPFVRCDENTPGKTEDLTRLAMHYAVTRSTCCCD